MGWIAVDLDGTLATGHDLYRIGPPVLLMVARVKLWREAGEDVRIFTARVGPVTPEEALGALLAADIEAGPNPRLDWLNFQTSLIEAWCRPQLGEVLPLTATKDLHMVQLWDDICVQVVPQHRGGLDPATGRGPTAD